VRNIPNLTFALCVVVYTIACVLMAAEPDAKSEGSKKEWGEPVAGQVISIKTNGVEFAPEERIVLTVRYKNVGQKPVRTMFTGNEFATYDIDVLLPNGKETRKTLYGKRCSEESEPGYVATSETQPGEEKSRGGIPLSRCFDFSLDGTYMIVVRQILLQRGKDGEVLKATSNKLKVTINSRLTKEPPSKSD
jgi:hypothetical protein